MRSDLEQPPCLHRLRLSLQFEWGERLDSDGVTDEAERLVTQDDLPRSCGLLEPRGDVHRVARREEMPAVYVAGDDLAGVDAGSSLDANAPFSLEVVVDVLEPRTHFGGGANSPQRIVLVEHRNAERRHDGIADEFLDRAAVVLDRLIDLVEIALHDPPHRLRVELLAQ